MKYFFVLGTNPTLSVAELAAVLDLRAATLLAANFLVLETTVDIKADNLIKQLGGIVKIGQIRKEVKLTASNSLLDSVIELASIKQQNSPSGKFNFGFSDYGEKVFDKKDLGLKLKKYFKEHNISSRFVVSREKNLSSVVVTQNKLLKRGIEIILVGQAGTVLLGETLAVQPFKDLSRRDYGRPARDDHSGMLPPKLAQIMINLAQIKNVDNQIIDPFCGSGTVLTEAMLKGYRNLFGLDVSLDAIKNTRKNVNWTRELYGLENIRLKLLAKNVIYLSKVIKKYSVDAIITEPYLGPQRGTVDLKVVIQELEGLYSQAFQQFREVIKKDGRIVMVWPVFQGKKTISPNYSGFKIINNIPEGLLNNRFIQQTARNTIIYGRPQQKVHREIVVLERE